MSSLERALNLVTPHLIVRTGLLTDSPAILEYFVSNRAHLEPWEPKRPQDFYSLLYWHHTVTKSAQAFNEGRDVRFYIFEKNNPSKVIGAISLTAISRGVMQSANLGYAIDQKLQGKGYMTEALSAVIHYAFTELNLHRIAAGYNPINKRSGAVLSKLGFDTIGLARDYLLINNQWVDHILTQKINPEFRPINTEELTEDKSSQ